MSRRPTIPPPCCIIFAVVVLVVSTGCAGYRAGSLMHPDVDSVTIAPVRNRSDAPGAGAILQRELAIAIARESGLTLAPPEKADARLIATISTIDYRSAARGRTADSDSSGVDEGTYRTRLYRAEVTLEVSLAPLDAASAARLEALEVKGTADVGTTADVAQARTEGARQALQNAARKAVLQIAEAW